MKAVILAAGRGERLSPLTDGLPKPLLPIGGRTLLEHVLSGVKRAGITEFIIVVGYLGDFIRRRLSFIKDLEVDIKWVLNPKYVLGNAYSLLCAERALSRDEFFLLSMSDHLYEDSIIKRILGEFDGEPLISVDREPRYLLDIDEATKVRVCDGGYVRDIGKEIPSWNAVDMGLFILEKEVFKVLKGIEASPLSLSHCLKRWISSARLKACDSSGRFWLDIDTVEDYEQARRMMGG